MQRPPGRISLGRAILQTVSAEAPGPLLQTVSAEAPGPLLQTVSAEAPGPLLQTVSAESWRALNPAERLDKPAHAPEVSDAEALAERSLQPRRKSLDHVLAVACALLDKRWCCVCLRQVRTGSVSLREGCSAFAQPVRSNRCARTGADFVNHHTDERWCCVCLRQVRTGSVSLMKGCRYLTRVK